MCRKYCQKLGKIIIFFLKIALSGALALIILSGFVLVYNYTGTHIVNADGATDYTWEPNQYKANMKEGFAWIKMDEHGFNNIYDSEKKDPDILLMGSSHMEAVQMRQDLCTGYLLNEFLPNYYTYNIGMSGHDIYRCIDNYSDAVNTYVPKSWVVIETHTVELDITKMEKVIDQEATRIPSYDSGAIYYLQKIPSIKALYNGISDWISKNDDDRTALQVPDDEMLINGGDQYYAVLCEFLQQSKVQDLDDSVQLIIVYIPTQHLGPEGECEYGTQKEYLYLFEAACMENDIIFVDMTDVFTELYREEYRLAHGFSNTGVGDGHLNQYGHRAVAEKLAETVREMEK